MPPWQRALFILAFAQFISSLGFSNIFPFLPFYVKELGSRSNLSVEFWVGMVFSGQATTMMIASPIWGALADRYGRKLMVERAMFGGAVIILLMAFVHSAEQLVLLRTIQGMITGTVSATNALAAATAPRHRTGYAMGVIQVSRWSGVTLGPLMGGITADAVGFRATFAVTAFLLALAGVLVWRGVEEHFVRLAAAEGDAPSPGMVTAWRAVLRAPGVGVTYTLRFSSWLGRTMLLPFLPLFVQMLMPTTRSISTYTGLVVGVASATGTASAIYLGRLGDRIGHRRILITCAAATALLYVPQSLATAGWQLLVLQALTGMAAGGIVPALGALLARYTRPGEEGAVYGLDNSIVAAATLLLTTLLAAWRLPDTRPEMPLSPPQSV
ncbi:MAG: MFS transporter [Caldilineae bacterium]|nr:MAG: MFS transporter [Caldilineae bacterium]